MNSPDYKDIVKRITDLKFDDREIAIMRLYNENYTRGASHFCKNISLGWQNSRLALPV
ncbi:hypothetical protein CKA32_002805 [Geitlerinema sp. FC II]|nr:hypothetical protein CKA32_002805 [Geitlerinema sp. FC II]